LNANAGGAHYRLLSEAEWEYAARAGGEGPHASGARLARSAATFAAAQTTEAGAHAANAFGLFDVSGNAAEWVEDCYAPTYAAAPADGAAAVSASCAARVYRGGSYKDPASALRLAARRHAAPGVRPLDAGFRVARDLP
ncbi:MAG: formylglycine-generating enzyme family protein, partial [Hyphomonadaceae bacterium]